ncbi:MAG: hypothetical protein PUH03_02395 [bacterium]|nr:hypothetical protein [bacterium]MDY2830960.1 hypothetical protein [Alphaproteobacteria bacterium]
MFWKRSNVRKYDHILSLGYNCEVSFQFFLKYHFVESSLFAWVNTENCQNLINALRHPDLILSQGVREVPPMYLDIATGISFHGKTKRDGLETKEEIEKELYSRISYLRDKFAQTARDGKKNLYIFKCPPPADTTDKIMSDIKELYQALKNIVKNEFDLLVITEKKSFPKLNFEYDNLFVRQVDFYTPAARVTSKPYDKKSYGRIFSEFRPAFKLPKTKHFKFEAED